MNEALKIYKKGYFWYQPKDGVGGDFYWSARTKTHQWLVIGDCTGHSMEGALASVSVLSILQQVFRADMNPHHLIKEVHQGLKNIQKQDLLEGYGIGCEMIVIRTDLKDKSVKYSGTGLPLYTIEGDKITPHKTKKSSLDPDRVVKFVRSRALKLETGAGVFTHCDGLIDQIGSNGKRLRTVTLLDSIRKEGAVNERSIQQHFDRWRGNEVQTDDVVCLYFQP
jgi:serine phosphatase RsbU (regulator of sigma subunit)